MISWALEYQPFWFLPGLGKARLSSARKIAGGLKSGLRGGFKQFCQPVSFVDDCISTSEEIVYGLINSLQQRGQVGCY